MPPSITSSDPVMWLDASEHRNSTPLAMSSACPALPIGTVASAMRCGSSGALAPGGSLVQIGVSMTARMHRVHPDVVARAGAFQRDRLGEQPHRALCRAVAGEARRTAYPGDRGHHHDGTAAGTAHRRDAVFHRQEHAVDIHRHLPTPVSERHVDRRAHDADAGVGHQNMQAAELLGGRDHGRPAGLVRHVMMQIDAADLLREALAARIVQVRQHQLRSLTRQDARAGRADARGRTGDDADLAVELTHRSLHAFVPT